MMRLLSLRSGVLHVRQLCARSSYSLSAQITDYASCNNKVIIPSRSFIVTCCAAFHITINSNPLKRPLPSGFKFSNYRCDHYFVHAPRFIVDTSGNLLCMFSIFNSNKETSSIIQTISKLVIV